MKRAAACAALAVVLTVLFAPLRGGDAQIPLPTAPAAPDPARLFTNQCGVCHTLDPNAAARQGPMLRGVVGRQAAGLRGFRYSPGFAASAAGVVWDEAKLDAYLTNPQAAMPGSVMAYRQANPATRAAIIGYLKEQN